MTTENPFVRFFAADNRFECLCRKFILASLLYYQYDTGSWPDSRYDNAAATLAGSYEKLPDWFTSRVSQADLRAGTAYSLTYTDAEREEAEGFLTGRYNINTSF